MVNPRTQMQSGLLLRRLRGGHLPPQAGTRAHVPLPQSIRGQGTHRDLPRSDPLRVISQRVQGAAGTLCCKCGAAGKKIHMRLSCSASCFYGCGRCSVVAFPPSQKAGSVSVVLTGTVFVWRIQEPWELPHDI